MDDTENTHQTADPLRGIYPERYELDDDQNLDTFCVVCGVPIRVMEEVLELEKDKFKWCLDAIGIRPSLLQSGTDWETSRWHWHGDWRTKRLHGDDKPMEILSVPEEFQFYQWDDLYHSKHLLHEQTILFPWVGMHKKCFDLMQRLLQYRTSVLHLTSDDSLIRNRLPSTRIPTSLGEMYEVYQSRIYDMPCVSWRWYYPYRWKVLEPHRYYYNNHFHDGEHVELFSQLEWPWGSYYTSAYETAPFPIENIRSKVLSYLKSLPAMGAINTPAIIAPALQSRLDRLPTEIQEQIYRNLHPFTDPPVECTRHLAPSTWKNLLVHGQILPWLWDLEELESKITDQDTFTTFIQRLGINEQKDQSSNIQMDGEFWDWELLVRRLARYDSFEPGGVLDGLPPALLNRRRIWRLLDEARQDDVDISEFQQL